MTTSVIVFAEDKIRAAFDNAEWHFTTAKEPLQARWEHPTMCGPPPGGYREPGYGK